jgi:DNA (cytosine-5)-methyltransferase 1
MKILNLYAGIGGNRKLWPEGHEVTAVENNPEIAAVYQSFYPEDKVIVGDAHEYLLANYKDFDFIWSSPPCQSHSKMNLGTRHKKVRYPDMSLYQEVILLKHFFKGLWVVENVNPYYDVLMPAYSSDRHLFWANFGITNLIVPKPVFKSKKESFGSSWLHASKKDVENWLGIYLKKNIYLDGNHCEVQVLRNCVHPKLGLHIFNCAFKEKQQLLEVA